MKTLVVVLIFIGVLELHSASAKEKPPAKVLFKTRVEYPLEARRLRQEGSGIYVLDIDKRGNVTAVHVAISSGHRLLDNAALEAFRKFKFEPGTESRVKIPSNWTLFR